MLLSTVRRILVLLSAALLFAFGCELAVDFDRTKIPVEAPDTAAPTPDAAPPFEPSPSTDASDASDADVDDASDASDGDADPDDPDPDNP